MKIQVHIVQGPAAKRTFTVEENSKWIIGRDSSANFRIENDELISREHFAIEFDGTTLSLTDLGSTNGTFVNNHRLEKNQPVCLRDGDSFVAGRKSVFEIRFEKSQQQAHPRPRAGDPLPTEESRFDIRDSQVADDRNDNKPGISPNRQSGGNFSQSIRKDLASGSASDPNDLLMRNPSPRNVEPLSADLPSDRLPTPFEPLGDNNPQPDPGGADFAAGSIAHPADIAAMGIQFPPLPGENPPESRIPDRPRAQVEFENPAPEFPDSIAPPGGLDPTPAVSEPHHTRQSRKSSPFESSIDPIESASDQLPADPTSDPTPRSAVADGSSSGVESVEKQSAELSSTDRGESIGLPNQMPVDQQRVVPIRKPGLTTPVPEGKVGYLFFQNSNGLYFYRGQETDDLPKVLEVLQSSFESIYCAHLFRAGIAPPASPPLNESTVTKDDDASGSNFENLDSSASVPAGDSPFESLPVDSQPIGETTNQQSDNFTPGPGTPLFSWLPREVRWNNPLLLTLEEFSVNKLEDLWQKDALVCFFGSSAKQLTEHCLELVRMNVKTGKKDDSVFGFCWPGILDSVLESQGEKSVGRIFAGGVAAIVMEDPAQNAAWNIVSKIDLSQLLSGGGFFRQN